MLETIRTAYLAAVATLIATYPAQEGNRTTYEARAAAMKLGRLRRRVRTKLHDFPQGTLVAFVPEDEHERRFRLEEGRDIPTVSIWARGVSSGATMTVVDSTIVEPVCETCQGSGSVRHAAGLVSFHCPAC